MRCVGIVQARYNSTRLPGKVIMPLNGLPVLYHCYRRMLACQTLDQVVCSIGAVNSEPITDLCVKFNMYGEVGPEDDLISRHLTTALKYKADAFVRVTADEPLIDPQVVDDVVSHFRAGWPAFEFACNWAPRTWPDGCDVDVISMRLLKELQATPDCPREDYSTWVTKNKPYYPVKQSQDFSNVNLCLDTEENHKKLTAILQMTGNDAWSWREAAMACSVWEGHP